MCQSVPSFTDLRASISIAISISKAPILNNLTVWVLHAFALPYDPGCTCLVAPSYKKGIEKFATEGMIEERFFVLQYTLSHNDM
jgi:hypothetical protein